MLDMQARAEFYTVRVIALTDLGIPLVSDLNRRKGDRFWKFPGGGNKLKDRRCIFKTARREMRGETNLELNQETSECLAYTIHRSEHVIYLVYNKVSGPVSVPKINVDNEEVKIFSLADFFDLIKKGEFLEDHLDLLRKTPKSFQIEVFGTQNAYQQ